MVRDGECSPSSEMTPVTGWKKEDELLYKAREVAKQESLVHYFSDEWFDLQGDRTLRRGIAASKKRTSNPPRRCEHCEKGWCYFSEGTVDDFYYLDEESFVNVPLEKEPCPNCE